MIVRCPECSTGFNLPDNKVTEKPVKLRCSKCSHVFHFRLGESGEADIFLTDSDREQNLETKAAASAEEADAESPEPAVPGFTEASGVSDAEGDDDGEASPNKTQFGMPAAALPKPGGSSLASKLSQKLSKSASSDYNPFPHANLDLQPNDATSLGIRVAPDTPAEDEDLGWAEEATRVMDVDAEEDDPFAGAFEGEGEDAQQEALIPEEDPFAGAFADEAASEADAPAAAEAASEDQAEDTVLDQKIAFASPQASPGPQVQTEPDGAASAAAQAAVLGAEAGASPFHASSQTYRPEDMVDPSFGQGGPTFDPERGIVTAPAAQAPRPAPAPARAPAPAAASTPQAAAPKPAAESKKARPAPAWEPEDFDEPIAPHTIGGGGPQKAANFVLILLVVMIGFFGVVAALSGGFLDFKRFPHMLEVAFQGAEFTPRAEWKPSVTPQVVAAPENPIRVEGVFAQPVERAKKNTVVLVRGTAKNTTGDNFAKVELRAILYDNQERIIAQTTALLGARVQQSALAEAESASALLPTESAQLPGHASQPFSLVFDELAPEVLERADISYRVEVASTTP